MKRHNYASNSGITIDRCGAGHGVWLDSEEIERVQSFVERWEGLEDKLSNQMKDKLAKAADEASLSLDRSIQEGKDKGLRSTFFGKRILGIK